MKMNPERCYVIILGDTNIPEDFTIQIDNVHRAPESEVTLLFITPDSEFDFNSHITKICKEASTKLNALRRISKYLTKEQKSTLSFILISTTVPLCGCPRVIFVREDSVNSLRCMFRLKVPRVLTTKNGSGTLSFRGSQIWNSLPNKLKELNSVAAFKLAMKGWNDENCNCRICSV